MSSSANRRRRVLEQILGSRDELELEQVRRRFAPATRGPDRDYADEQRRRELAAKVAVLAGDPAATLGERDAAAAALRRLESR